MNGNSVKSFDAEKYSCDFIVLENAVKSSAERAFEERGEKCPKNRTAHVGGCLSMLLMTIGLSAGFVTAILSMLAAL